MEHVLAAILMQTPLPLKYNIYIDIQLICCCVFQMFDHIVFAFFAVEMLIKMIAMGIWGKLGYLGEAWNRLDFFIVLCG